MLHPGAWWIWALGMATAASRTTNLVLLALILAVVALVVAARRGSAPWARGFKYYLYLALIIIAVRVVFRVLLDAGAGTTELFTLPELPLPEAAAGIRIGGLVTAEAVVSAVREGLRLATLIICIGAANVLANPKRLLASVPPALHEVAVGDGDVRVAAAPALLAHVVGEISADDAEDQGILGGDSLYDEELFRTDTVYRRSLVNLNVTAFLVHHADAHDAQFLLVKDSGSVRVYTVDNSMAFQSITNPMVLFREDWATLRVPLVDTKTRARIAAIDERALQALATVEEYEDRDGMLTPHAITDPTVQRDAGMRWFGKRLQVGLTQGEIAGVRSRVQELKQRLAE